MPGRTRAAYEAGLPGFGLARALAAAGIGCVVAAPGKIERPATDPVKADPTAKSGLCGHLGQLVLRAVARALVAVGLDHKRPGEVCVSPTMNAVWPVSRSLTQNRRASRDSEVASQSPWSSVCPKRGT